MNEEAVAHYARLLWERGWVANHDGNVSVRFADDRFLATPTAESKRLIQADWCLVVDTAGTVIQGERRIFSEWNLHRAAYEARPDVRAVVHAHPVMATAAGLTGLDLSSPPLPEAIVSLGGVPTARPSMPGPGAAEVFRALVVDHDAVLLPGNGVVTVGDDLEQAYLRMELVEHIAAILTAARSQGGRTRSLPHPARQALLEKRTKAGLGPEARRLKAAAEGDAAPASASERAARARATARRGDALATRRRR